MATITSNQPRTPMSLPLRSVDAERMFFANSIGAGSTECQAIAAGVARRCGNCICREGERELFAPAATTHGRRRLGATKEGPRKARPKQMRERPMLRKAVMVGALAS